MRGICFSSEKSDQVTQAENGIDNVLDLVGMPVPDVYSAALSEFVFAAGVKLMPTRRPDVMYLSTTDYIQHKHAPGTEGANAFYRMMDGYLAQLDAAMGAVIALTADHGMNAKVAMDGTPDHLPAGLVRRLAGWWQDAGDSADHRSLRCSSRCARLLYHVYLPPVLTRSKRLRSSASCEASSVLERAAAAKHFELPADRIGDRSWSPSMFTVIGTSASKHDLSGLDAPLRSHGGVSEQRVPLIVNRACPALITPAGSAISIIRPGAELRTVVSGILANLRNISLPFFPWQFMSIQQFILTIISTPCASTANDGGRRPPRATARSPCTIPTRNR